MLRRIAKATAIYTGSINSDRAGGLYMRVVMFWIMLVHCSVSSYSVEHVYGFFDFPPFIYLDEQAQVRGHIFDNIMQPISRNSKHSFKYKRFPAKRLYAEIVRGSIDVMVTSKVPSLVGISYFSQEPVLTVTLAIFSVSPIKNIDGIQGLKGQRLGGIRGLEFLGKIKQIRKPALQIQFRASNNRDSLYRLLAKGRVDYVIDYLGPATSHFKKIHQPAFYHVELTSSPAYLAVPKALIDGQTLLHELEAILTEAVRLDPGLGNRPELLTPH